MPFVKWLFAKHLHFYVKTQFFFYAVPNFQVKKKTNSFHIILINQITEWKYCNSWFEIIGFDRKFSYENINRHP